MQRIEQNVPLSARSDKEKSMLITKAENKEMYDAKHGFRLIGSEYNAKHPPDKIVKFDKSEMKCEENKNPKKPFFNLRTR